MAVSRSSKLWNKAEVKNIMLISILFSFHLILGYKDIGIRKSENHCSFGWYISRLDRFSMDQVNPREISLNLEVIKFMENPSEISLNLEVIKFMENPTEISSNL